MDWQTKLLCLKNCFQCQELVKSEILGISTSWQVVFLLIPDTHFCWPKIQNGISTPGLAGGWLVTPVDVIFLLLTNWLLLNVLRRLGTYHSSSASLGSNFLRFDHLSNENILQRKWRIEINIATVLVQDISLPAKRKWQFGKNDTGPLIFKGVESGDTVSVLNVDGNFEKYLQVVKNVY